MADIQRSTLAAIDAQEPTDAVDRVTVAAMKERLGLEIESFDNTEFGDINNITTPLQGVAEIFDLMPSDTAADWELITARLRNVPQALKGWQETLLLRAEHGPANATRQINLAIDEAAQKASDASGIASSLSVAPQHTHS